MKKKRILSLMTAVFTICFMCSGCSFSLPDSISGLLPSMKIGSFAKSDEQMIQERIEQFTTSYNIGDMEAVLDCFDAKMHHTLSSSMNIIQGVGSSLLKSAIGTDLGLNLYDLFGVAAGLSPGDLMQIDVLQIEFNDEKHATVDAIMKYNDGMSANTSEISIYMLKEKGDWYINTITD